MTLRKQITTALADYEAYDGNAAEAGRLLADAVRDALQPHGVGELGEVLGLLEQQQRSLDPDSDGQGGHCRA